MCDKDVLKSLGIVIQTKKKTKGELNVQNPMEAKFREGNAYTGCNRRNVRDFGRVFVRSNYTDITQNTYIQS